MRIVGPSGRRELALQQLFRGPGQSALGPGELLESVLLGPPRPSARGLFQKKRRVRMDLALASLALLAEIEGNRCVWLRVAAGSVAPTPVRLESVERLLEGQTLDEARLDEAQQLASTSVAPITDLRCTEEYRRHIIGVYLRRGLEQLMREEEVGR